VLLKTSATSDGRATVTDREVILHNEVIFNSRSVAPGDPAGSYRE